MRLAHRVSRTISLLLVCILGASCGDGADSDSQRRVRVPRLAGPELVPKELVAALLSAFVSPGATVPEIVVGRMPDDLPFEVPRPENSRVVGGVVRASRGTLVFAVAQSSLDAIRAYQELLRRTGWDDPAGEMGSGFQPPDVVHSGTFCQGDGRWIATSAAERSDGQTFLQVQYGEQGRSPCDQSRRESRSLRRGPMPTFYPPRKTSILDGNLGGGRNFMEANARLKTELRPPQLVAHYGAQLRAAGWAPRTESQGADVSAQTWRIEDRRGNAWVGLLLAIAVPDSEEREVLFRVTALDSSS
jgi:hypothetical protein